MASDKPQSVSVAEGLYRGRDQCDREGDQRDRIGRQRDDAADRRDDTAAGRDDDADQRDRAADKRDRAADRRDHSAQQSEASLDASVVTEASHPTGRARLEAAADRRRAWKDRQAGHRERAQAQNDRSTALADRVSGAGERSHAGMDRRTARADRRASASLLEHAAVDALTGMYLRGAGLVELERQMARARRTQQALVVAFVDVDRLKAFNDAHGHAAGDRMLLQVATTLGTKLRPYDLIIRYGGDEFVCAILGMTMGLAAKRFGLVNAALAAGPEQKSVTYGLAELQPGDSPGEVVARADAALYRQRQRQSHPPTAQVWGCGNLVVDEANRAVRRAGSAVAVTESEFAVLRVLIRNRNRVVPQAQLLGQAWGHPVDHRVLETHVRSLRRKLEIHGPRQIHTIRGSGYVLRP